MPRNRKNRTAAVRFGLALKLFILCLAFGVAGIGYVWQKRQIYALAQEKTRAELRLMDLQRQNRVYRDRLDMLRLPMILEARVKELNLGLAAAQPEQMLRLAEPSPTAASRGPVQQVVNRSTQTASLR